MGSTLDGSIVLSDAAREALVEAMGDQFNKGLLTVGCMDPRCCHKHRHPVRTAFKTKTFFALNIAGGAFVLAEPDTSDTSLRTFSEREEITRASQIVAKHGLKLAMGEKGNNLSRILLSTHPDCAHVRWEGYDFSPRHRKDNLERSGSIERLIHREKRKSAAAWLKRTVSQLTKEKVQVWGCMFSFNQGSNTYVDIEALEKL